MSYRQAKPDENRRYLDRVGELSDDQFIVVGADEPDVVRPLLVAHMAGDKLMILRRQPVLVYPKYPGDGDEHEHSRLYGDLILYRPWRGKTERQEFGAFIDDKEACRIRHVLERPLIEKIKEKLKSILLS